MQLIIYLVTYPFFMVVSLLPFKVMYLLSDLFYLILYYLIGYRKKVVQKNLKLAYPDKTEKERLDLEKKSYRHFVDIFFEMAKTFTVSKKELLKRYKFSNTELIDRLHNEGRSVIMMSSHYGNWEWSILVPVVTNYTSYATYTEISNPYFNKAVIQSRGKFGAIPIEAKKTVPAIIKNSARKKQALYGLISDQSPSYKNLNYFTEFFGVKVPVHIGAETLAKKYDIAVVMLDTQQTKRGYYQSEFKMISEFPKQTESREITQKYLRETEHQINRNPSLYFWTHNRFKHSNKAPKD
ncbi:MAG: lysophospholipid acyltransferase family protein [Flavobacteriaceae bacterium]